MVKILFSLNFLQWQTLSTIVSQTKFAILQKIISFPFLEFRESGFLNERTVNNSLYYISVTRQFLTVMPSP